MVQDKNEVGIPACGLSREELAAALASWGVPSYRAGQVWRWIHGRGAATWEAMTDLPAALRTRLGREWTVRGGRVLEVAGEPGVTRKLLVALHDGEQVEAVLIPAPGRRTVCVSTQAGCRFGCAFCASGQGGYRRNLDAGEIVGQVLIARDEFGERPTHVVFMGMGEPLDNYEAVLAAIRILNDPEGLGIGARRMTLSTCGVVPGISRLAGEGLQVELSVSLHAPDDELRARLMPVNRRYPIRELMEACRAYTAATKRIITFEYTLVRGLNDSPEQARRLAALIRPCGGRVNLIPLSPVEEFPGEPPTPEVAARFLAAVKQGGVHATLRVSKGARIRAACGQLRGRSPAGPEASGEGT